jgi:hypothetical protein
MNVCEMFDISGGFEESSRYAKKKITCTKMGQVYQMNSRRNNHTELLIAKRFSMLHDFEAMDCIPPISDNALFDDFAPFGTGMQPCARSSRLRRERKQQHASCSERRISVCKRACATVDLSPSDLPG